MTELRAADLRFTPAEAAEFLNQVMGLNLSEENIAALETRTEGWIAGLQLAALSLQGHRRDTRTLRFVHSFSGSNRFVLDYLAEEVLQRQEPEIQEFLLKTSILDRMNAPLCDAVMGDSGKQSLRLRRPAGLLGESQSLRGGTGRRARAGTAITISLRTCCVAGSPRGCRIKPLPCICVPAPGSKAAGSWRKPSRILWQPVRWSGPPSWLNRSP